MNAPVAQVELCIGDFTILENYCRNKAQSGMYRLHRRCWRVEWNNTRHCIGNSLHAKFRLCTECNLWKESWHLCSFKSQFRFKTAIFICWRMTGRRCQLKGGYRFETPIWANNITHTPISRWIHMRGMKYLMTHYCRLNEYRSFNYNLTDM